MRPLLLGAACIGLAAVACWGATRPGVGPAHAPASSGAGGGLAHGQIHEPKGNAREPLDLREFTPILALPELTAARAAQESEQPAVAAALVLKSATAELTALDQARRQFVAAKLFLEAGQLQQAKEAFQGAAALDWVLQSDAWLGAAEVLLREGQPAEALVASARARFAQPEARQLLVEARAFSRLSRWTESDARFDSFLNQNPLPEVRLEWAGLRAQRATAAADAERTELARAALADVQRVQIGLPRDHALAPEVQRVRAILLPLAGDAPIEPSLTEKLAHLAALIEKNALDEALEFSGQLSFAPRDFGRERCQFESSMGKLLSLQRKWGEASDRIDALTTQCDDDAAAHARLLFNAGKYAAADGRDARAVRHYAALEELYPKDSLADDARLRRARSYKDMGAPARFVDLLSRMPEDYPEGDMTGEGVLELALYSIERKDWAAATLVLESGARAVRARDAARGHEFSGCERYFLARAHGELGKRDEELSEYEQIVQELPLSYYMLHAYSRLHEVDPERAARALTLGRKTAAEKPFSFPHRPEFDTADFKRGMELLRVSELEAGRAALSRLRWKDQTDQALLWGIALLYDRAGDAHVSFAIARGRLTDWLSHYPEGDWERPWQIGFPRPYYSIVQRESLQSGVPEWFIYGIMREESTFDPSAESPAAAYGLMQLIVPTARVIGKQTGLPYSPAALKQPRINIAMGSRVLASLAKQFPNNPLLAIPGYNAGPGRPRRWLSERPDLDFDVWVEMIPFRETRRYTKRVLASRAAYAFLYDRDRASAALLLPRRLVLQ